MANGRDFLTGLLKGLSSDLEQRRQNRLELALLSRRIEMEQAAKRIPQEEFGQVLGGLGFPQEQAEQLGQIQSVPGQQALTAAGRPLQAIQARGNLPKGPRLMPRIVGNQAILDVIDPMTGRIIRSESRGLSGPAQRQLSEVVSNFSAADAVLDEVENFSETLLVPGTALQSIPNAAKLQLQRLAQLDPNIKAFLDGRENFALQLTALVSGKQMTEPERLAILRALPGPIDTLEVGRTKLKTFRSIYENTKERKLKAILNPLASMEEKKPLQGQPKAGKKKVSQAATDYLNSLNLPK